MSPRRKKKKKKHQTYSINMHKFVIKRQPPSLPPPQLDTYMRACMHACIHIVLSRT